MQSSYDVTIGDPTQNARKARYSDVTIRNAVPHHSGMHTKGYVTSLLESLHSSAADGLERLP